VIAGVEGDSALDVEGWDPVVAVHAGANCMVGIKEDGTLEAAGFGKTDWGKAALEQARSWRDIISVSSGLRFIAALTADGTVVCTVPERYRR
jgi:alpha-tubulin suppressor-like RCC1 family protein